MTDLSDFVGGIEDENTDENETNDTGLVWVGAEVPVWVTEYAEWCADGSFWNSSSHFVRHAVLWYLSRHYEDDDALYSISELTPVGDEESKTLSGYVPEDAGEKIVAVIEDNSRKYRNRSDFSRAAIVKFCLEYDPYNRRNEINTYEDPIIGRRAE